MTLLTPEWVAPPRVRAAFTTRAGGISDGPYASLNLAAHVGDAAAAVAENRARLARLLGLPSEPAWLTQVHGTRVLELTAPDASAPTADAAATRTHGVVLAVLVADCLPVLFASRDASVVAVAHAGWRGLAAGVLDATVAALEVPPEQLSVWIGPGIGREHFEVGNEVREAFLKSGDSEGADAFSRNARGRWQCDLARLAWLRLRSLGVAAIHGADRCTYAEAQHFYSYRREGATGRMAGLIWLEP